MTLVRLTNKPADVEQRSMYNGMGNYPLVDPAVVPPYPGYGSTQNQAGVVVNTQTIFQVSAVYACLRVLCTAMSNLYQPHAYKWGYTEDNNLPYKVRQPNQPEILSNPFKPFFFVDGMNRTVMSMGLYGEAWWYTLDYDNSGYPQTLEVLNPALLRIIEDETGKIVYRYGLGAKQVDLDQIKLTHIPSIALPGSPRGISILQHGTINAALALASLQFGANFFKNGASPSFILSTDQDLSEAEVTRIAEVFQVEKSGLAAAHLPLVLANGITAEKISSTPDEAQFIQTMQMAATQVAAWFGIPAALIDVAAGSTPSRLTGQEQTQQMLHFTLSGYIKPIQEAFSSLLPAGTFAGFDEMKLLAPTWADLSVLMPSIRNSSALTANELRVTFFGLPPVTNEPQADQLVAPLPSNVSGDAQDPSPDKDSDSDKDAGKDADGDKDAAE